MTTTELDHLIDSILAEIERDVSINLYGWSEWAASDWLI